MDIVTHNVVHPGSADAIIYDDFDDLITLAMGATLCNFDPVPSSPDKWTPADAARILVNAKRRSAHSDRMYDPLFDMIEVRMWGAHQPDECGDSYCNFFGQIKGTPFSWGAKRHISPDGRVVLVVGAYGNGIVYTLGRTTGAWKRQPCNGRPLPDGRQCAIAEDVCHRLRAAIERGSVPPPNE
jgi:hypothetical protein